MRLDLLLEQIKTTTLASLNSLITDETIVGQAYIDANLGGNPLSALVMSPSASEQGYALIWNNTTGEFTLSDTGSGEVNTASNLGAGEGLFAVKSGADLQFKSLVAGTNISLSSDGNTVTVNNTATIITNSGLANEMVKSDGTDLIGTSVFSTSAGNIILGSSSLAGASRSITADSSAADAGIFLLTKGSANVIVSKGGGTYNLSIGSDASNTEFLIQPFANSLDLRVASSAGSGTSNHASNLILKGAGAGTDGNGGHVFIDSGVTGGGTGVTGSIGLFTETGSFGGGAKVLFIANAATVPTTNPTGGGILYVESGGGKMRTPSGNVVTFAPDAPQTGYTTFTNLVTDRTLDADSTTTGELADVLGTLIEDLKALGLISA